MVRPRGLNVRLKVVVLRHALTTCRYSDKALLGDRTQGESVQVFLRHDRNNRAEEEDDKKRPSVGKVCSGDATIFSSAADPAIA